MLENKKKQVVNDINSTEFKKHLKQCIQDMKKNRDNNISISKMRNLCTQIKQEIDKMLQHHMYLSICDLYETTLVHFYEIHMVLPDDVIGRIACAYCFALAQYANAEKESFNIFGSFVKFINYHVEKFVKEEHMPQAADFLEAQLTVLYTLLELFVKPTAIEAARYISICVTLQMLPMISRYPVQLERVRDVLIMLIDIGVHFSLSVWDSVESHATMLLISKNTQIDGLLMLHYASKKSLLDAPILNASEKLIAALRQTPV